MRYTLLALSLLLIPAGASAQSIDPTVEVTRTYQGKMIEVQKPMLEMQVPDSVTRFDLEFDYSVFDSPYNGIYEFDPYLLSMKPQPDAWSGKRLFLRAGAGYPLHPVFDFVWSPDLQGRFRMSLYASHRSYVGGYRYIGQLYRGSWDTSRLTSYGRSEIGAPDPIAMNGYDMLTRAGANGRLDWSGGAFTFDIGYYGIATKDTLATRGYDAVDARFRVRSNDGRERHFMYDVALDYRFGMDKSADYRGNLGNHDFALNATAGPVLSPGQKFLLDMDIAYSYASYYSEGIGEFALTPRYVLKKNRWSMDLGVRIALLLHPLAGDGSGPYSTKGQVAYPDINIDYTVIKDYLDVYLDVGGGNSLNRYSDILEKNHWFCRNSLVYSATLGDYSVERVSAALGFKGNISTRFMFDIKAGYSNHANAMLDAVVNNGSLFHTYGHSAMQMFFSDLGFAWKSEDVSFDGSVRYCTTDLSRRSGYLFAPAALSGYGRCMYNWHSRIFAGVDCGFSTGRRGGVLDSVTDTAAPVTIPGYADLGVYFEFRAARLFSFWLRGGNLIDMTVQHTLLYAESGINFTAGICLNL